MNWMETLFGLNLDNGDGSVELALILSVVMVGALLLVWRRGVLRRSTAKVNR